mgnify:CR=1 FL=1
MKNQPSKNKKMSNIFLRMYNLYMIYFFLLVSVSFSACLKYQYTSSQANFKAFLDDFLVGYHALGYSADPEVLLETFPVTLPSKCYPKKRVVSFINAIVRPMGFISYKSSGILVIEKYKSDSFDRIFKTDTSLFYPSELYTENALKYLDHSFDSLGSVLTIHDYKKNISIFENSQKVRPKPLSFRVEMVISEIIQDLDEKKGIDISGFLNGSSIAFSSTKYLSHSLKDIAFFSLKSQKIEYNQNLLHEPILYTTLNQETSFFSGQKIEKTKVISNDKSLSEEKYFIDVGLSVLMKIKSHFNGKFLLEFSVNSDDYFLESNINSTNLETFRVFDSGEVLQMLGSQKIVSRETVKGYPILNSIPILGYLFTYKETTKVKQILLYTLRITTI